MAKKHSKRIWYTAIPKSQYDRAFLHRKLPAGTIFYDEQDMSYSDAAKKRFSPLKDALGEHILDDKGYAQLPEIEAITIIAIKGQALDWKQVVKAPRDMLQDANISCGVIKVSYPVPINKQTVSSVHEETDEALAKFTESPLVKAGHSIKQQEELIVIDELDGELNYGEVDIIADTSTKSN